MALMAPMGLMRLNGPVIYLLQDLHSGRIKNLDQLTHPYFFVFKLAFSFLFSPYYFTAEYYGRVWELLHQMVLDHHYF
jgi:hypothetical protein